MLQRFGGEYEGYRLDSFAVVSDVAGDRAFTVVLVPYHMVNKPIGIGASVDIEESLRDDPNAWEKAEFYKAVSYVTHTAFGIDKAAIVQNLRTGLNSLGYVKQVILGYRSNTLAFYQGAAEYLNTASWKSPRACRAEIGLVPKYQAISAHVAELTTNGAGLANIAAALGETYLTVHAALAYATTGAHPKPKVPGQRTGTGGGPPKYQTLAAEVARLRDEEGVPLYEIAARLGVAEPTARRAYRHAHRDAIKEAIINGKRPRLGRQTRPAPAGDSRQLCTQV